MNPASAQIPKTPDINYPLRLSNRTQNWNIWTAFREVSLLLSRLKNSSTYLKMFVHTNVPILIGTTHSFNRTYVSKGIELYIKGFRYNFTENFLLQY
jgi:hypothetical protein